jgi:hypothetical protein
MLASPLVTPGCCCDGGGGCGGGACCAADTLCTATRTPTSNGHTTQLRLLLVSVWLPLSPACCTALSQPCSLPPPPVLVTAVEGAIPVAGLLVAAGFGLGGTDEAMSGSGLVPAT